MSLGYPYSYGDELSPKMAKRNLALVCLYLCLMTAEVGAVPLPGVDGLVNQQVICPRRSHIGLGKGGRSAATLGMNVEKHPSNESMPKKENAYVPDLDVTFDSKQLQRKYKHAKVFGVMGPYNKANEVAFKNALIEHMRDPTTELVEGTYRGKTVKHYFNKNTRLNVTVESVNGSNNLLSGWQLTNDQFNNLVKRGSL